MSGWDTVRECVAQRESEKERVSERVRVKERVRVTERESERRKRRRGGNWPVHYLPTPVDMLTH